MSTLSEGLVLHSGGMIRFHLDQDVFVEAIADVEYESEDRVDEKEVEGEKVCLAWSDNINSVANKRICFAI